MAPPDFTQAMCDEQTDAWFRAADAFRAGDYEEVTNSLAGPFTTDDAAVYARQVTMCTLGAILCAASVAKLNGHALGEAPGLYVLQSDHPLGVVDPNQRSAAQCITYAANGDFHMVADLVNAHHRPDDVDPGLKLLLELLRIFVAVEPRGGE